MVVKSVAITNVGKIRQNNEDNFYLCGKYREDVDIPNTSCSCSEKRDNYLFSVCDGMGGEAFGELASLIAVRLLDDYAASFCNSVHQYVDQANSEICAEIEAHGRKRIGTTFAALYIEENTAYAYNIGDSRIYHIRDNRIAQISEDHTQVQMMINQGVINAEDARKHSAKHVLTQHMGIFPEEMLIEPFCAKPINMKDGDAFLLCSDGLTDALTDADLLERTNCGNDIEATVDELVEAAIQAGSRDNITVVLVKVFEDTAPVKQKTSRIDYNKAEEILKKFNKSEGADLINEILSMIKNRTD